MSRRRAVAKGALLATAAAASLHLPAGPAAGLAALTNPSGIAPTITAPAFAASSVVVGWKRTTSVVQRAAAVRANGASLARDIGALGTQVLRVPAGAETRAVTELRRSGLVRYAERDALVHATDVTPNDPYWTKQWGENEIHAPATWSTTTGSSAVTVAVLDTGLNPTLSEFAGRVVPGYNALTGTSDVTDDNSHGTAATSVALSAGNNATAVAGLCWQCRILPVKVLDSQAAGTDSTVAAGVTWAVDHGAKVLNLSLGGPTSSNVLSDAVAYAQAHGALVVASAGNNSSTAAFYPAAYPGVVSVAATDATDTLYSYSDSGSWVDVAAAGSNYAVWPSGSVFPFGGTSSAAPVVAGTAALIWSAVPTATATDVQSALTSTATPIKGGTIGSGRIDAAAALTALTGPPASPSPSASPAPSPVPSPPASPSPTASPAMITTTTSGSLPKGSSSASYDTSGGSVTVRLTTASNPLTVAILVAGQTVTTGSGTTGLTVTAAVPSGTFTVTVSGPNRSKFGYSVTRPG